MQHNRKIAVVGLGYVGLTVAAAFAKHNKVIAYDQNQQRIAELKQNFDRNNDVDSQTLATVSLDLTADAKNLAKADFIIVAVPTPITATKQPDLTIIKQATKTVAENLQTGSIVVFESTVYPGVTEEECIPILEKYSNLVAGKDFFVGYSPERINPGDQTNNIANTIKIVSAQDSRTLDIIASTYEKIVDAGIHRADSIKIAEAAKVIENTQRDVNVALMNELAIICHKVGIDTKSVLEAAGTKWNFLPFRPGLVGGHCIGVDPYYLTYKANTYDYHPEVILAGRRINDGMGKYIAEQTLKEMIHAGQSIKNAKVVILGATFKENCPDIRNSRVFDMVAEFKQYHVDVLLYDPVADAEAVAAEYDCELCELDQLQGASAVIVAVAHQVFQDIKPQQIQNMLCDHGPIMDVKGVLAQDRFSRSQRIWRL